MKSLHIVNSLYPTAFEVQNGARFEVWSSKEFPRTLLGMSTTSSADAWHDAASAARLFGDGARYQPNQYEVAK